MDSFGWPERFKVAVGVAEALDYLHNCREEPVIHRDVKSSNILLSENYEPQVSWHVPFSYVVSFKEFLYLITIGYVLPFQLSDFGLASWASSCFQITCTDVAGTFGYAVSYPLLKCYIVYDFIHFIKLLILLNVVLIIYCFEHYSFLYGSYLAPEYFMHGKVSDKIDVYAFGVVLLELLSGRKPISNNCPKGQESLVMWVSVDFPTISINYNPGWDNV